MEFIEIKHCKKRKRKRSSVNNKQYYDQIKFEVISDKSKIITERNIYTKKKKKVGNTMDASAFWENYKAAHEWQKTHNITWWKTRCIALEHENHILQETIRNIIKNNSYTKHLPKICQSKQLRNKESLEYYDIEFQLNKEVMDFLTQSIRHKIELQNKKKIQQEANEKHFKKILQGRYEWVLKRNEDAKLLYGKASSKILAMETALQTTIERFLDTTKPQYWPNIPLRL